MKNRSHLSDDPVFYYLDTAEESKQNVKRETSVSNREDS